MVTQTNPIPEIPAIPPVHTDDPALNATIDAMKEALEVLTGSRGNPNNRAITYGEATEDGLTDLFVTNRVVETALNAPVRTTLTGDIAGEGDWTADGYVTVATNITLPNIVLLDGGASDTTYTGAAAGPYGIEGAPEGGVTGQVLTKQSATDGDFGWQTPVLTESVLEIQEDGGAVTTACEVINFVGFNLTQPVSNEITITITEPSAGEEYDPGYDYTYQSTTTFTVDLVDATNLFRNGRRVKFGKAGVYTYGTITAQDYNSTHANDTFVTVTMESGNVPNPIDELAFVASSTSWSGIVDDPFSGTAINDICTGAIGATQWWIIVGDSGKVAYSTDAGATWTLGTSGTSEKLYTCCYDAANEKFWFGGENNTLSSSDDGTTWTDQSALLDGTYQGDTGDHVLTLRAMPGQSGGMVMGNYNADNAQNPLYVSDDEFATMTFRSAGTTVKPADKYHQAWSVTTPGTSFAYYGEARNTSTTFYTSFGDTVSSTGISASPISAAAGFEFSSGVQHMAGTTAGVIDHTTGSPSSSEVTDDATFTQPIRDFAHSPVHGRVIVVGDSAQIGYISESTYTSLTGDAWTAVANGFDPLTNISCVEWNAVDGVFVACAENGQICRSTNGTN